jgi:hypothetical protein
MSSSPSTAKKKKKRVCQGCCEEDEEIGRNQRALSRLSTSSVHLVDKWWISELVWGK